MISFCPSCVVNIYRVNTLETTFIVQSSCDLVRTCVQINLGRVRKWFRFVEKHGCQGAWQFSLYGYSKTLFTLYKSHLQSILHKTWQGTCNLFLLSLLNFKNCSGNLKTWQFGGGVGGLIATFIGKYTLNLVRTFVPINSGLCELKKVTRLSNKRHVYTIEVTFIV